MSEPARLSSPSALRNREVIGDVLVQVLAPLKSGLVVEIASGSGEHVAHFAERLPHLTFQPGEMGEPERASIRAHTEHLPNVREPLAFDVLSSWPVDAADAIVCINMLHASIPETAHALFQGAARILPRGAPLLTYGPYKIAGAHTAPSNETFDAWLKTERNPRWGVRDLEWLEERANRSGMMLTERIAMPANNFVLVWRRGEAKV